jgi:hypothetical protein
MRTSGGRGLEGWIMAIPVLALVLAAAMRGEGPNAMLMTLERTIREGLSAAANFLGGLL